MIVDCARDPRIFGMLLGSQLEYSCLYSGTLPPALECAAPYLLRLEYDERPTRRFLENAWGNSWGIFLKCNGHIQTLRRHLRCFLTVRDPDGHKLLFRYYDPRVLRPYLPTCFTEDLQTVFGPITKFWTEGEKPDTIIEFSFDGAQLLRHESPLDTSGTSPSPTPARSAHTQRRTNQPLSLRTDQLSTLSQQEVRKFEDWMVAHLNKFFQQQCRVLGEAKLRSTVQYGIQRAAAHGIKAKRDVCKYIDIMLALGHDFDQDKQNGWAAEILQWDAHASVKIQNLIAAAKTRLRQREFASA